MNTPRRRRRGKVVALRPGFSLPPPPSPFTVPPGPRWPPYAHTSGREFKGLQPASRLVMGLCFGFLAATLLFTAFPPVCLRAVP